MVTRAGSGARCTSAPGALDGGALLDRVGELVGQQVTALGGARLVLVAREEDVVAVGERPGAEVVAEAGGALVGVDADVAQVGAEPRLHEPARVGRQRLAAGRRPLDLGLRVGGDARRALAEPLDRLLGGGGPLDLGRPSGGAQLLAAPVRPSASPCRRCGRPPSPAGRPGLLTESLVCTRGCRAGLAHHGREEARAARGLEEAAGARDRRRVRLGRLGRGRPHRATATPPAAAGPSRAA